MIVRALVLYREMGKEECSVIEPFEIKFKGNKISAIEYCHKARIIRKLLERKIKCSHIENLDVQYIYD